MAEILLRLRVLDHGTNERAKTDKRWQRSIDVEFLPSLGDLIQLWGREDSVLSPVRRRWWRPDGTPLLVLAQLSVDSPYTTPPPDEPGLGLRWIPWSSDKGDLAAWLRSAGWAVLTDA